MKRDFWEERYGDDEYVYGTEANEFFKVSLGELPPGRLLLPAEGEGRNAVYAAKLAWEVHAFDQSSAAKLKALNLADSHGVNLNYDVCQLENYQPSINNFDLIALIYVHMPPDVRSAFHKSLLGFLKPGASVILEAFSKEQIGHDSGGPKVDALLYDEPMIRSDFRDLKEVSIRNEKVVLDEGRYHRGRAEVIRMIGKI